MYLYEFRRKNSHFYLSRRRRGELDGGSGEQMSTTFAVSTHSFIYLMSITAASRGNLFMQLFQQLRRFVDLNILNRVMDTMERFFDLVKLTTHMRIGRIMFT